MCIHPQPFEGEPLGGGAGNPDPLSFELLQLAAAWVGVFVHGLSRDAARRVIRHKIAELRAVAKAREDGL